MNTSGDLERRDIGDCAGRPVVRKTLALINITTCWEDSIAELSLLFMAKAAPDCPLAR